MKVSNNHKIVKSFHSSDKFQKTTLSIFPKGYIKIAELLIQNGATGNVEKGKFDETALILATKKGKDQ